MKAKKILSIFLILICVVSLAGCNSTSSPAENSSAPTVEDNATQDQENKQQSDEKQSDGKQSNKKESKNGNDQKENEDSQKDEEDGKDKKKGNRIPVIGDLKVDQDKVYSQLNTLLGTDIAPPNRIVIKENSFIGSGALRIRQGFFNLAIDERGSAVTGYSGSYSDGVIELVTKEREKTDIEATLAHEYVHHIQNKMDLGIKNFGSTPGMSYEQRFISRALDEGGAVYVTNEYVKKYMNWKKLKKDQIEFVESNYKNRFSFNDSEINSQIEFITSGYKQLNAAERYFAAPYYHGSQYISKHADSVKDYFKMYENPPKTTEQLIHGYAPGEEKPVAIKMNTTGLPSRVPAKNVGRVGEITLRLSLMSELSEKKAVKAAEGWGNDRLIQVIGENRRRNYVWTIRMDTKKDTKELIEALGSYMKGRSTKKGQIWFDRDEPAHLNFEKVGEKTVIVSMGSRKMVGSINGSIDGEEVVIGFEE